MFRSLLVRCSVVILLVLALASSALADVRLPTLFSDNMVLQQGRPVPIWGWAKPGETIRVAIDEQKVTATADDQSRWRVVLDDLTPNASG